MTYRIEEINADEALSAELLLDPLFLVEPPNVPPGRSVIKALVDWEFVELACDAQIKKETAPAAGETQAKGSVKKSAPSISAETEEISLDDFMSDTPKSAPKLAASASPTASAQSVASAAPAAGAKPQVAARSTASSAAIAPSRNAPTGAAVGTSPSGQGTAGSIHATGGALANHGRELDSAQKAAATSRMRGEVASSFPTGRMGEGKGWIGSRPSVRSVISPNASAASGAAGAPRAAGGTAQGAAAKISGNSEALRMENVKKTYIEYQEYLNALFTRYATHNDMDKIELLQKIGELCKFIRDNKSYMLRVVPSDDAHKGNAFVSHAMRSTVLAIAIGLEMRISPSRLEELGAACILHEIGMLALPPQIYVTQRTLTASERALIETHCTKGAAIAGLLGFSDSVKNGIEDHHECKNGAGYPNRKMGDLISTYGKIIAVACSYEAITAPRVYKPQRSGFEAMVEMLKNKEQKYDDTVIKALLYCLSLFPIGAFVFLSDGRIAYVTDVNPNDPKNPIVQMLNERTKTGAPLTVQTNATTNKVVRVLSREEIYDAIKSMKK